MTDMGGPPYDDEELIADFNNDYDDDDRYYDEHENIVIPPQCEYEELYEPDDLEDNVMHGNEMMVSSENGNLGNGPENVDPPLRMASVDNNHEHEREYEHDTDYMNLESEGIPLNDIPSQVVVSTVPQVEQTLYSFERYSRGMEWRQSAVQNSGDVMEAVSWKSRSSPNKKATTQMTHISNDSSALHHNTHDTINRTSAPEVQLVHYLKWSFQREHYWLGNVLSQDGNGRRFQVSSKTLALASPCHSEEEDHVWVTIGSGQRVYIHRYKGVQYLRSDTMETDDPGRGSDSRFDGENSNNHGGLLLGISMKELTKRADAMQREQERKKRMRMSFHEEGNHESHMLQDESENMVMEDEDDNGSENGHEKMMGTDGVSNRSRGNDTDRKNVRNVNMDRLWVDKHAPSHFSDLLSDERINREVLRALRQWDPFVFGKDPPPRPVFHQQMEVEKAGGKNADQDAGKGNERDKRPDEQNRVILLSGPPGVGKTTLAHIIASHAGYRPIEVNASDERSASVLTERVTRAMESSTLNMKRLSGKEDPFAGRPNCLILDEVDGADAKSSIMALVNIIKAELPSSDSRKKGKKTFLRRPIIFICNHKHAPALRPLLPFAKIFDVKPPSTHKLVSRLKAVLAAEQMTLVGGNSMLYELVERAGGDIRSCLFTLQFSAARSREVATKKRKIENGTEAINHRLVDITSSLSSALGGKGVGIKDERSDMAGTLKAIFCKLKSRIKPSDVRDLERVLDVVESFGDYAKTLDSLFLNILNVSYVDPTMDRCWVTHEWLSAVDIYRSFKTSVASNNTAELRTMQKWHIPSAVAACHILCRVETRPELNLSMRLMNDATYRLEANIGLVEKFLESIPVSVKSGINKLQFISDVLPYCLWLLSAGGGDGALNRPVSSIDILSKQEKASFDAHVTMLRTLGLTYVRDDDNSRDYGDFNPASIKMRLEPEIDKLSKFVGMSNRRRDVPPLLKELLAHAANLAGMRDTDESDAKIQNEDGTGKEKRTSLSSKLDKDSVVLDEKKESERKNSALAIPQESESLSKKKNHVATNFLGIGAAKAKAARNARKAALVGFERSKNRIKISNTGTGVPIDQVLRFKYQKGFTQAVRVPLTKKDLI